MSVPVLPRIVTEPFVDKTSDAEPAAIAPSGGIVLVKSIPSKSVRRLAGAAAGCSWVGGAELDGCGRKFADARFAALTSSA